MDADYVSTWSKNGTAGIENCRMLCKIHNWAKGNKIAATCALIFADRLKNGFSARYLLLYIY